MNGTQERVQAALEEYNTEEFLQNLAESPDLISATFNVGVVTKDDSSIYPSFKCVCHGKDVTEDAHTVIVQLIALPERKTKVIVQMKSGKQVFKYTSRNYSIRSTIKGLIAESSHECR